MVVVCRDLLWKGHSVESPDLASVGDPRSGTFEHREPRFRCLKVPILKVSAIRFAEFMFHVKHVNRAGLVAFLYRIRRDRYCTRHRLDRRRKLGPSTVWITGLTMSGHVTWTSGL